MITMSRKTLHSSSLLVLLVSLLMTPLTAQIEEIPLNGSPQVARAYHQQFEQASNPLAAQVRDSRKNETCVAAGDTLFFCVDTTGIGPDATIQIIPCSPVQYGTVALDSSCIRYIAKPDVILGIDTLCLEVCDSSGSCTTTSFTVHAHRSIIHQTAPLITLGNSVSQDICQTRDLQLGQPVYEVLGMIKRQTGTVITLDSCYRYLTSRFAGLDEVVYLANYPVCVTDTFIQPFRVTGDTIDLPFFDDFSYPGPFPDPAKWLDDRAYVNDRMAWQPPSIGVATLDGLDEQGRPYDLAGTERDILTSPYFDLSVYSPADNLIFSFWAQPKGLGFRPEVKDSLVVEFKDINGIWQEAERIPGYVSSIANDSLAPFVYRAYGLGNADYLYKGFQFRFRNRSDLTGSLDLWHIDYVRLGENLTKENQDIAFTARPNTLLDTYTAMPWRHIQPDPSAWLDPVLQIGLYNHFPLVESANPSEVEIVDRISGQTLVSNITLLELPPVVPVNQRDLAPGMHTFTNTLNAPNLAADLQALSPGNQGVELEMTYRFDQDQESNIGEPVALRNNEVHEVTNLTNYFAYDDGSAESAIIATKSGTQVAVKYTAAIADTLRAIQFHFPRYNVNVTTQYFNLRIWAGSLNSTPIYEDFFVKPFYPDLVFSDSLQAFTTYVLYDEDGNTVGIPIPKGDFYVGWQQGSNVDDPIPVGYDKNHPSGSDHAWLNTAGTWIPFPISLRGALMIRPVVGDETPTNTPDLAAVEHPLEQHLQVYPNPSRGMIYLNAGLPAGPWTVQLLDMLGHPVVNFPWSPQIDMGQLPSGWYTLLIRDEDGQPLARRQLILQD